MERRILGKSDLDLSVLGMGCWQFGGGSYWGAQSQKDVDTVVSEALDIGINYFDTAEVYNDGASEESLGLALKGKRTKAIIGTKITPANLYPSRIKEHCEASLTRLGTDYIDLYMVHWPISPQSIAHFTQDENKIKNPPSLVEAFAALDQMRKEGKIRYIGISNHGINQMEEVIRTGVPFVANELAYNLFSRAIEESILPFCIHQDIGVIGYMPLQQGLLSGKYADFDTIKPMQARSRHFHYTRGTGTRHGELGAEEEIRKALIEIQKIADDLEVSVAALSLSWVISQKSLTTTIVGSRNKEQLAINVQGTLFKLSQDVIAKINQVTEPVLRKLGSNPDYYESRHNSRIS